MRQANTPPVMVVGLVLHSTQSLQHCLTVLEDCCWTVLEDW